MAPNIVIGGQSNHDDKSKPEILLFAADILPRHCYFYRSSAGSPTMLCPYEDATVTRNGEILRTEVQLTPGDVIGLGQHYLFLFKDPLAVTQKVRHWTILNINADFTYIIKNILLICCIRYQTFVCAQGNLYLCILNGHTYSMLHVSCFCFGNEGS